MRMHYFLFGIGIPHQSDDANPITISTSKVTCEECKRWIGENRENPRYRHYMDLQDTGAQ